MTQTPLLKLRLLRDIFRLVGEVREVGSDPQSWRPHMIQRLAKIAKAQIVVSSEVHFRTSATPGTMRVFDIGWGADADGNTWQINTERDGETPESWWLVAQPIGASPAAADQLVPVKPTRNVYGGRSFMLSQVPLLHLGGVDQLGLHRSASDMPFTAEDHRLVRIFHLELGRLWKQDTLKRAQDPTSDLPPRLAQTLAELQSGSSEKQVSIKLGISRHTVHNYVKALHRRLGVSSRGELLAKMRPRDAFVPKLSLEDPPQSDSKT